MSDLDADLYGGEPYVLHNLSEFSTKSFSDLYENDFTDQAQEETEAPSPTTEPAPKETPAAAPPKPAVSTPNGTAKPVPAAIETSSERSYVIPTSEQSPSTPSFAPATQQIPTYEQPQPSEYREQPPLRSDGSYQNIPVPERTVRPSEMKDEG